MKSKRFFLVLGSLFVLLACAVFVAAYDCDSSKSCFDVLDEAGSATLVVDLTNIEGNAITIPHANVVFDCGGHSIVGKGYSSGILVDSMENVTIVNCNISNFKYGINLQRVMDANITNNILRNNTDYGLLLYRVSESDFYYNDEAYSFEGIYLEECSDNTFVYNKACSNIEADIRNVRGLDNLGQRTECDNPVNWDDENTVGCTFSCLLCDDYDQDRVCNTEDNCKIVANNGQGDSDGGCAMYFSKPYGIDPMCGDACDKCPSVASNTPWIDSDFDGKGDVCDSDDDNDGCADNIDPWPTVPSLDSEWDGYAADCDNCPLISNPGQENHDSDPLGDACDDDDDQDGCWDSQDAKPLIPSVDLDLDGVPDDCDNCLGVSNSGQENHDSDPLGDACDTDDDNDKCLDAVDFNPIVWSHDNDNDGRGADCDNCPNNNNSNQRNRDGDGAGDSCDCDDNYMGPNEKGADCGGVCSWHMNCTYVCPKLQVWGSDVDCSKAVPILINGGIGENIDILFVPDNTYPDINQPGSTFFDDVRKMIDGFYGNNSFSSDVCHFNFFYYNQSGEYKPVCDEYNFPFTKSIRFFEQWGLIFVGGKRACTAGGENYFATSPNADVLAHEFSHSLFGLLDEYCCDGGYGNAPNLYDSLSRCQSQSTNPGTCYESCPTVKCWPGTAVDIQNCSNYMLSNGWGTENCNCTAYANAHGLNPNDCKTINPSDCPVTWWRDVWSNPQLRISGQQALTIQSPTWCNLRGSGFQTCCGGGWWASDLKDCRLDSGWRFEPDCKRQINNKFNSMSYCVYKKEFYLTGEDAVENNTNMTFFIAYNILNNTVTELNVSLIYAPAPLNFLDNGEFVIKGLSAEGSEMKNIWIEDPRLQRPERVSYFDSLPSVIKTDNVNFIVAMPFTEGMELVKVVEANTLKVLAVTNLTEEITDFCADHQTDPQCKHYIVLPNATVYGHVLIGQQFVPNASVTVTCSANGKVVSGNADSKGYYSVKISCPYSTMVYVSATNGPTRVCIGSRCRTLQPAAGSATGTISSAGYAVINVPETAT